MTPALTTPWIVKSAAGQPISVVRLRNLQFTAPIGVDAWGRPNRPQPVLVSASVSLARAFTDSSSADKVDADTVHYGLLSKAVLGVVNELGGWAEAAGSSGGGLPLRSFLDVLWVVLTGLRVDGSAPPSRPAGYEAKPFLALDSVRYLSVTVQLPKASLSGGGVSLTGISLFGAAGMEMYGLTLRLHRLQVPTLIGVNSNEREAKQVVLADVEIDNFVDEGDICPGLENAVYEDMSGSSFATLESLVVALAASIRAKRAGGSEGKILLPKWQIRIQLEKPVAVPLAEGAGIEYLDMGGLSNH